MFDDLLRAIPTTAMSASERTMEALARAQWSNLLTAMQRNCLGVDEVRRFLETLNADLEAAMTVYAPSFTALRQAFQDVKGNYAFTDTRPMPGPWNDMTPVTLQSSDCLQYWFKDMDIGLHLTDKPSGDEIDEAIKDFRIWRATIPTANRVGKPSAAVWFAPMNSTEDLTRLTPDGLRDELGMVIGKPARHGILVILAERVQDLIDPLPEGRLRAPNVFDSGGHQRFRHWPTTPSDPWPEAGRTYDLKAGGSHGRPELIHAPRPVCHCVDLRNLGAFEMEQAFSEHDHRRYADDLVGGRTVRELVEDVIARL